MPDASIPIHFPAVVPGKEMENNFNHLGPLLPTLEAWAQFQVRGFGLHQRMEDLSLTLFLSL